MLIRVTGDVSRANESSVTKERMQINQVESGERERVMIAVVDIENHFLHTHTQGSILSILGPSGLSSQVYT